MRPDDPNLPLLTRVAEVLGDLREELVFVGGCAAGLLLDDPAAGQIRATQDVDAIVEAATLGDLYRIEARLAERGFVRDEASGVICRWQHRAAGALFDLMPIDPAVLGFSNPWYPEAMQTAQRLQLRDGIVIRLISAPAFVATKLEAFASRGRRDFLASHDLEDVLNLIEGRPGLGDELLAASPALRSAVRSHCRHLLAQPYFVENLGGLIGEPDMADIVLARLRTIAAPSR
jgi:hypothetical protein